MLEVADFSRNILLQMQTISNHLEFIRDLAVEYKSSLDSLQIVKDNYACLHNNLETQVELRSRQKNGFVTKVGAGLRSLLLEGYRGCLQAVYKQLKDNEEMHLYVRSHYLSLKEIIANAQSLIGDMDNLKKFIQPYSSKVKNITNQITREERIIGENNHLTGVLEDYRGAYLGHCFYEQHAEILEPQKQLKMRVSLLRASLKGSQELLSVESQISKSQIMQLQKIIDECLSEVCNLGAVSQRLGRWRNEKKGTPSNYHSLGIDSVQGDRQINLYCLEELGRKPDILQMNHDASPGYLQKITEREEDQSEVSFCLGQRKGCQ